MTHYTLHDNLFVASVLSGLEGVSQADLDGAYLVGGGAVQFYAHDHQLWRPTLDADIQTRTSLSKTLRLKWGQAALDQLRQRGYSGSYRHARSGAEVKLNVPEGALPFFLHLDVYTPRYVDEHQRQIDASFERRRSLDLEGRMEGMPYFIQAPEDLVLNKLKRPYYAMHRKRLCPEDEDVVQALIAGCLDDIDAGDLSERLEDTLALRNMGMEEITRKGFKKATQLFDRYKDQKDIYDILLLIASDRQKKIFDDDRLIRENAQHFLYADRLDCLR